MAGSVAAMSSGFKNLSNQMAETLTAAKVEKIEPSVPLTLVPIPPSASNTPGPLLSTLMVATIILPTQLDRSGFPKIKHWFEDSYQESRKGGKRGGEGNSEEKPKGSVLSSYMEDLEGNEIPESSRRAVRRMARSFFIRLLQDGAAPDTWGNAPLDAQNQLIFTLETQFPFLRYCENHWKSTMVATNSYSQWYKAANGRWANIENKRKTEVNVIDVDTGESSKRPQTEGNDTRPSKRPRLEEVQHSPSPRSRPLRADPQRRKVCIFCSLCYTYLNTYNRLYCTNVPPYVQGLYTNSLSSVQTSVLRRKWQWSPRPRYVHSGSPEYFI
jgi:hypothetical protein